MSTSEPHALSLQVRYRVPCPFFAEYHVHSFLHRPANTVDLELHESGGFQIYGDMEEGREGEIWEHRGLKQQTLG